MTADEIRKRVDDHVAHYRARDVDALVLDHAPNGIVESPSSRRHQGHKEIEAAYRRWLASLADLEFTLGVLKVEPA